MIPHRDRRIVLTLNRGASSLKFALFSVNTSAPVRVAEGAVEDLGGAPHAWLQVGHTRTEHGCDDAGEALSLVLSLLAALPTPEVVGHRVVHGGARFIHPVRVDSTVIEALREVIPLAPLHLPVCILAMDTVLALRPSWHQVACFDTAFHATLPASAFTLPIPGRFGLRRYGFHGLSYESVMATLGAGRPSRIIIAHLGAGVSLAAVRDGRSVDTTMGLTPGGGLPMSTRSGDLDPGVVFALLRQGLAVDEVERVLEEESGLLAVGGTSNMIHLLAGRGQERPALAVSLFTLAVRKAVGAYVAELGGVDLLVFTGGIGEGSAQVRAEVCEGLGVLGIRLDTRRNEAGQGRVSATASPCEVRVVHCQEDVVIAAHAARLA